jgi:hypothetical protein
MELRVALDVSGLNAQSHNACRESLQTLLMAVYPGLMVH